MKREDYPFLKKHQKGSNGREPAKYYEPLYFYDGHTRLTEENQQFMVEVLDKNQAVGIYGVFEEEGYPIYCMSGFAMTSLGYDFDELLEETDGKFLNLIYEKDRHGFEEAFRDAGIIETEFRMVTKEKKAIWVHSYRRKNVLIDGKMVDIASVRVVDDSVKREGELLAALAKEYSEIVYIDENKGRYRRIKSAESANEMRGSVAELNEKLKRHMKIIHPDDHAFEEVFERINSLSVIELDRGGDYRATYRARLGKEYVWLQFRAIFGGNMNLDTGHIVMTFRRVDREVQRELDANRILTESLARAEQAGRIKNQFLSRMSHDLRTPLNGIMGLVEIMKKNAQNPAKILECSRKIQTSCQHLLSLVNDVLDMSNLERGRGELEEVPFDISTLIENEAEFIRAQVEKAGLVYRTSLETFHHRNVIGSPDHIRQIFSHILNNAILYNKPGGEVHVYGREVSDSDRLAVFEFAFEDTGFGMSKEFVKRIFEPFEQERNDARTIYAGTGLGMAIVKKMVDQMNGDIAVESTEGVGTKISVTLPFKVCSMEEEPEEEVQEADLTGKRALLVEDNELNMEIAQFMLENLGFEVYGAENGQVAVELFEESNPGFYDMIFMDLMMPVMDGYEAARQIRAMDRKDARTVPIIAVSANVMDEDIRKSKMAGMNEHLAKPIEAAQVRKTVVKYIRGKS